MQLFNKKPKYISDVAFKLFLKSNDLHDSPISKSVFDVIYSINSKYYKQALIILRKDKIKKIKYNIKYKYL